MSTLGALVRSIENPTVPLSSPQIAEFFHGFGRGGTSVSEDRAYGLSAWYRAVALTASALAVMPIKVYRNGTRERVTQRTVLDNPNPRQTPFEYWQTQYANAVC